MTNYAVLIGNSQFPKEPSLRPLSCPDFDVEGLAAVLTAEGRGQFTAENIVILKNKRRDEIEESLNSTLNKATKDDLFLLYYSGHGLTDNNSLYLSTVNINAQLLLSTAVSFNHIYDWINNRFFCKKIIIILDCCYSGAAGTVFSKGNIVTQLQTLNNTAKGTFLITASSNDQVAQEKSQDQYSLFTSHLIRGLETGEADKDEDGFISIDELFRYVYKKVVAENPAQIPKRFLTNETGELFIAKSPRDSRNERAKKMRPYFLKLVEEDRIAHDILTDVLKIIFKPATELSALEKEKDKLINEVFENKDAVNFVRKWDKLIDKSEPDKSKIKLILFIAAFIMVSVIIFKSVSDKPKNPEPVPMIQKPLKIEADNSEALAKAVENKRLLAIAADNKAAQQLEAQREAEAKAAQEAKEKALAKQQRQQAIAKAKSDLNGSDKTKWSAAMERLESLKPLDAEAMYLLGSGYNKAKNFSKACEWLKNARDAGYKKADEFARICEQR